MAMLCIVQVIIIQLTVIHFTPKIEVYSQRAAIDYFKGLEGQNVYIHSLGYKSYATMFYAKTQPATDPHYRCIRLDKKGKEVQPEANEQWLLKGTVDKPVYFICKIQDSVKYAAMPQLMETGSANGFVFFSRK